MAHEDTMKAIVLFVLVTVVCSAGFTLIAADKICAISRRDDKSILEQQNSADDIEDAFNTNNHNQVCITFVKTYQTRYNILTNI